MDQAQQLRNIIKAGNTTYNRPLARIITVTSGKGGVGKSNTAINLAIQFRKEGKRVIILDADLLCKEKHAVIQVFMLDTDFLCN